MVDRNIDLKKYKGITSYTEKGECLLQDGDEVCDEVLLFFSFDIVNSSLYKTINYYGWSMVIDYILQQIRDTVKVRISNAEVWRVFGDEIVFIVKICEKDSVYEYTDVIYEVLSRYCDNIDNGTLFEGMTGFADVVIDLMKLQDAISLQACAWLAVVTDKKSLINGNHSKYVENVFEVFEENPNNKFYEFMGVDIDAGFRLTKETRARRLVVSFELAFILAKQKEYAKKLNIVTYRKLKGVWNNAVYPIIWYYDPIMHNNIKFKNSMPFDAIDQDDIYVEFFQKREFADYMYNDVKGALKKICRDRKLQNKINNIEKLITEDSATYRQYINNSKLELHCVAVCFNKEGKILLVKRCDKDYLPGKWEFGCAKANYTSELVETIECDYKKDFNLTIKVLTDMDRLDKQPIPLAVYTINRNGELHKGIIFLAEIIDGDVILDEKKHQDYKFISEEDISGLAENELVSDAIDTIKKSFKLIKEIKSGKGKEIRIS